MTREEFVARVLRVAAGCGPRPAYGSPEWEALDRLDPRRFASAVVAAECWRADGTDEAIAARLLDELAYNDAITRFRIAEASRDLAAGYVYDGRPSFAELQRRRAQVPPPHVPAAWTAHELGVRS